MTNEEILKKAMLKAFNNTTDAGVKAKLDKMQMGAINDLIFDHDFAKAFWGEKKVNRNGRETTYYPWSKPFFNWQYHLKQMVIQDNPIKYLEQFFGVKA